MHLYINKIHVNTQSSIIPNHLWLLWNISEYAYLIQYFIHFEKWPRQQRNDSIGRIDGRSLSPRLMNKGGSRSPLESSHITESERVSESLLIFSFRMPRFAVLVPRRTNSFPGTVTDSDATGQEEGKPFTWS